MTDKSVSTAAAVDSRDSITSSDSSASSAAASASTSASGPAAASGSASASASAEEAPAWLAAERAAAGDVETADLPSVDPTPDPIAAPDPVVAAAAGTVVSKASIADIEEAMKDVVDPELGINVVDLGLVYGSFVDDDNVVTLDMTLTSAACPLTDVIEDQTRAALTTGPGGGLVQDFRINWVWLPPWGPDKITDDGREQLRALGFNV